MLINYSGILIELIHLVMDCGFWDEQRHVTLLPHASLFITKNLVTYSFNYIEENTNKTIHYTLNRKRVLFYWKTFVVYYSSEVR